jgi:hypothetical protein
VYNQILGLELDQVVVDLRLAVLVVLFLLAFGPLVELAQQEVALGLLALGPSMELGQQEDVVQHQRANAPNSQAI